MWVNILLKAILFVLLVPGTYVSIPRGGRLFEQAVVHSLIFTVANYLVYIYVRPLL